MKKLLTIILIASCAAASAQNLNLGEIHGNFQLDAQYYQKDSLIGAPDIPEKILSNGFMNLTYTRGNFFAGLRYESYLNPLSGFSGNYQGTGIPHRYAGYSLDNLEITVGSFYEQFGNGLIFRSYEEKNLGIDNSIDGLRLRYQPHTGIYLKGFIGRQRSYFSLGPGLIRGIDAEFALNDMFDRMQDNKVRYVVGGSVVSKYQQDDNPIYRLPENVAAFAGRGSMLISNFSLSGEYVYKMNDPSADNNFIYKPGEALLLNAGYATKGFGLTLSAKRIDNMAFRSDRNASVNDLTLSFLPAITRQHTYMLPAFYPCATQPNGEIGFQGELVYNFKKGTVFGGKYGTNITLNYSEVYGLDTTVLANDTKTGYKVNSFFTGKRRYFQDYNIEINKKLSNTIKVTALYMHEVYDKDVIQGLAGYGKITSEIGVVDITYKLSRMHTLRTELHHLYTKQDMGSWAGFLAEYTIAPHYFVAVFDQYNYGNKDANKQLHYYTGQVGYLVNTLRIAVGYGRQREGIVCVGGVCRRVPASSGVTLAVTHSF